MEEDQSEGVDEILQSSEIEKHEPVLLPQRHVLFDGFIRNIIHILHKKNIGVIIPVEIIDLCYSFYQIKYSIGDTVKLYNFSLGIIKWIGQLTSDKTKIYVGIACEKINTQNKNMVECYENGYNGINFYCKTYYDAIFVPFDYIIGRFRHHIGQTITRQIDRGLRRYYAHKNIPYENEQGISKFITWLDENGYDSEVIKEEFKQSPDEAAIVEFDDNFPTDKTGYDKEEEIFQLLKQCYKDPNAFNNSTYLPDENANYYHAYNLSDLLDVNGVGSSTMYYNYPGRNGGTGGDTKWRNNRKIHDRRQRRQSRVQIGRPWKKDITCRKGNHCHYWLEGICHFVHDRLHIPRVCRNGEECEFEKRGICKFFHPDLEY